MFVRGRELKRERIGRVVVRGVNWVGDAVMTVPALRELRRVLPGAHITLATRGWAEGIFAEADFLDEILVTDGEPRKSRGVRATLGQARLWRTRRFDLALLFPNSFQPALVAFAARVPFRIGYATDGRGPLLTHALAAPDWRERRHEVFYYLNLVSKLERLLGDAPESEQPEPQLYLEVSESRVREAREMLCGRGINLERPLVALCPGSTNSRAKRWPAERFAVLADMLIEEAGAQVLLVGAREESEVSDEVVAAMRQRAHVLTGETSLAQSAAILRAADLLVTNDTGPAHLAAAVGCPVVVIFGPTNPVTTRPFSDSAEVVRQPPFCAPCMLRDCPIDHRCMTAIAPSQVFERALKMLEQRRGVEVAR